MNQIINYWITYLWPSLNLECKITADLFLRRIIKGGLGRY
jgi:hypothetical protein